MILVSGFGLHQPTIKIHLVGDSTMSDKAPRAFPEAGWGTPFSKFFDETVEVTNYARNGRSTRTFREEGHWNRVLERIGEGDYVFIQFGHNDEVATKWQSTTPDEFRQNLEHYVAETRGKGAIPVLLTPVVRRHFDDSGKLVDTHEEYSPIVRSVAEMHKVAILDIDAKSYRMVSELGPEKSVYLYHHLAVGQNLNYPDGVKDDTHFNELGAKMIAELVVLSIIEELSELATHVLKK